MTTYCITEFYPYSHMKNLEKEAAAESQQNSFRQKNEPENRDADFEHENSPFRGPSLSYCNLLLYIVGFI